MVDPITPEQAIEDAASLFEMLQSPGWKIMEHEASGLLTGAIDKLCIEKDASEVTRLQARIKALRWLIDWPKDWVRQNDKFQKESAEETQPES